MLKPGGMAGKDYGVDFTILDISGYELPRVPSKTWKELIKKVWEIDFLRFLDLPAMRLGSDLGDCFIMFSLRSAGFFRLFRGCVCPAFYALGFRSDVQRIGGTLFDGLLSILFLIISCGSQIL